MPHIWRHLTEYSVMTESSHFYKLSSAAWHAYRERQRYSIVLSVMYFFKTEQKNLYPSYSLSYIWKIHIDIFIVCIVLEMRLFHGIHIIGHFKLCSVFFRGMPSFRAEGPFTVPGEGIITTKSSAMPGKTDDVASGMSWSNPYPMSQEFGESDPAGSAQQW